LLFFIYKLLAKKLELATISLETARRNTLGKIMWKADLFFASLVQIKVGLVSACGEEGRLKFRDVDPSDNTPIKLKKVNASTGAQVQRTIKAYEVSRGTFVPITEAEIARALPEASRAIQVMAFVDRREIPPQYFGTTYFLKPLSRHDEMGYHLFHRVLTLKQQVGVARFVMRSKPYMALVVPYKNVLLLCTLKYIDEVRDSDVVGLSSPPKEVSPKELKLAEQIVDTMQGHWNPIQYPNDYRDKILKIIWDKHKAGLGSKSTGKKLLSAPSNLFSQLRESLQVRPKATRRIKKKKDRRSVRKRVRAAVYQ
jgi:DNA end-binding protein Ku